MPDPRLPELLSQSAAKHNHPCPRQVLGVRMGMHAAGILSLDLPQRDKRLLTIVEIDGCFADGIAVATGCWLGRRTLRCVDYGKVAATFVDTHTGEAMRIHPSAECRQRASHYAPTAEDRWHAYLKGYQLMPAEELFVVEQVCLDPPVGELVSGPEHRAVCEACGEEVFNQREIVMRGRVLCRACAEGSYATRCPETVLANGMAPDA